MLFTPEQRSGRPGFLFQATDMVEELLAGLAPLSG
jgi:hypothetical protein